MLFLHNSVTKLLFDKHAELIPLAIDLAEHGRTIDIQISAIRTLTNIYKYLKAAESMFESYAPALVHLVMFSVENVGTTLHAIRLVYGLSCAPANRDPLRNHQPLVDALSMVSKQKDVNSSFFAILTLVNLFGAMETSSALHVDQNMLTVIFHVISAAMDSEQGWPLNNPLLAFRYLCVVEENRKMRWKQLGSAFLDKILAALGRAIDTSDYEAAENAVSVLAQFASHEHALSQMKANKAEKLNGPFARFKEDVAFHNADKTAQFLRLTISPSLVEFVFPSLASSPSSSSAAAAQNRDD